MHISAQIRSKPAVIGFEDLLFAFGTAYAFSAALSNITVRQENPSLNMSFESSGTLRYTLYTWSWFCKAFEKSYEKNSFKWPGEKCLGYQRAFLRKLNICIRARFNYHSELPAVRRWGKKVFAELRLSSVFVLASTLEGKAYRNYFSLIYWTD